MVERTIPHLVDEIAKCFDDNLAAMAREINQYLVGDVPKLKSANIYSWRKNGSDIPAYYCYPIEIATAGEWTAVQLRPDVFADIEVRIEFANLKTQGRQNE